MKDSTWKSYGGSPNSAFLIGKDGSIKLAQPWFKPYALERALLAELGGRRRKTVFKGRPTILYVLLAGLMASGAGLVKLGLWGARRLGGLTDSKT